MHYGKNDGVLPVAGVPDKRLDDAIRRLSATADLATQADLRLSSVLYRMFGSEPSEAGAINKAGNMNAYESCVLTDLFSVSNVLDLALLDINRKLDKLETL